MKATVNGKLVDLPAGTTVEELRAKLPEIGQDDVIEEGFKGTKPLQDNEALKEGSKVWTVPKIVKGVKPDYGDVKLFKISCSTPIYKTKSKIQ